MSPITLTDAAVLHIKQMLAKQEGSVGFRLSIKKTGCSGFSYVPEVVSQVSKQDIHFMAQENLNVYLDPECAEIVSGLVIDYVQDTVSSLGLKQKRLVFINPNEKNRCGCGESFTL